MSSEPGLGELNLSWFECVLTSDVLASITGHSQCWRWQSQAGEGLSLQCLPCAPLTLSPFPLPPRWPVLLLKHTLFFGQDRARIWLEPGGFFFLFFFLAPLIWIIVELLQWVISNSFLRTGRSSILASKETEAQNKLKELTYPRLSR